MNSRLPEFLRAEASRPWIFGQHDCGLWLADWKLFAMGGPDPFAHFRGTYANAAELRARHGRHAVLRHARSGFADLMRTADPLAGDIGVLAVRNAAGREAMGAIRAPGGWVVPSSMQEGGGIGLARLADDQCELLLGFRIEECDAVSDPGHHHGAHGHRRRRNDSGGRGDTDLADRGGAGDELCAHRHRGAVHLASALG